MCQLLETAVKNERDGAHATLTSKWLRISAGVRQSGTAFIKNLKSSSKGPVAISFNKRSSVLDSTVVEQARLVSVDEGPCSEQGNNIGLSHQVRECFSLVGQGVPMLVIDPPRCNYHRRPKSGLPHWINGKFCAWFALSIFHYGLHSIYGDWYLTGNRSCCS